MVLGLSAGRRPVRAMWSSQPRSGAWRAADLCHDRDVIGWTATTAGISGGMIRDMMVHCVESRFGTLSAPYRVRGSPTTDRHLPPTRRSTLPWRSISNPESNGMAEAFVKTFKRDYVRVNPIPDATTALEQI